MSATGQDGDDLSGYKRPAPAEYEPVEKARVTATDFNPFAALGLEPSATAAAIRPAFLRSLHHRATMALINHPSTATAFLSQLQIMQANEYLSSSATALATARNCWTGRHVAVFHPTLPVGDPGVFGTATGPAPAAATPTTNRSAAATPSTTGSWFFPSSGRPSSSRPSTDTRPPKARRTATAGPGSTPRSGSGSRAPFVDLTEDEEDDDVPAPPSPSATAAARRAARPYSSTATSSTAATSSAAAAATAALPSAATAAPRPVRQRHRSGGNAARNNSVANPITNVRINVGTWHPATGAATPNVVVAGFDVRGRLFYRVMNQDVWGATVGGVTATATTFEEIDLRAPYAGNTATAVRDMIERHYRLPPA